MTEAYQLLYQIAAVVLGLMLAACLLRAIIGPRIADRLMAVNMMGTLTTILVCILAFLKAEGYLIDVAILYAMLSFLAVVLLSKIYIGVYHEKRKGEEKQ